MKAYSKHVWTVLAVCACGGESTTTIAAPPHQASMVPTSGWTVTELTVPSFSQDGMALSAVGPQGDVVGTGFDGTFRQGILRRRDGRFVRLRPLSGDAFTTPTAVSATGQAAGVSIDVNLRGVPVVWDTEGRPVALPGFTRGTHRVATLTRSGLLMGETTTFDPPWSTAFSMQLGSSGPVNRSPLTPGQPTVVGFGNERGDMVGQTFIPGTGNQPTFWLGGGPPQVLSPPNGFLQGSAVAVNGKGVVVGRAFNTSFLSGQSWFWDAEGGFRMLPMPPGATYALVFDIDDRGRAFGSFGSAAGPATGIVMWSRGGMEILPPGPYGNLAFGGVTSSGRVIAHTKVGSTFRLFSWGRTD